MRGRTLQVRSRRRRAGVGAFFFFGLVSVCASALPACGATTARRQAGVTITTESPGVSRPSPESASSSNPVSTGSSPPSDATTTSPRARSDALIVLNGLPVGGLDASHHYERKVDFGQAWTDDNDDLWGHNGCDTRDDLLAHSLTNVTFRPGTGNCVVIAGRLDDPYSGQVIDFTKSHAVAVQIDHIVPLHSAWELGAWQWTKRQRIDYANDPVVLVAVSGPLNEAKGDELADRWLPPNVAFHCVYAARTVTIHAKYNLPVTAGEKAALESILVHCGP